MTNPLGAFVPKANAGGDKCQPSMVQGRPLIVQVTGYDGAKMVSDPNGGGQKPKSAVTVNVWDLNGGPVSKDGPTGPMTMGPPHQVYIGALWIAGAVADQLADHVGGGPLPIKIMSKKSASGPYSYLVPVALEGQELTYANQVYASDPQRFERETQQRLAVAAQQVGQFQQQGQAAGYPSPNAQPGPIANIPAQVAQQWAPVAAAAQVQQAPPQQWQQPAAQYQPPTQGGEYPNVAQQQYQPPAAAQYSPPMPANQAQYAPPVQQQYQPPAPATPMLPPQAAPVAPGQQPYVHNSDVDAILQRLNAGPQQG